MDGLVLFGEVSSLLTSMSVVVPPESSENSCCGHAMGCSDGIIDLAPGLQMSNVSFQLACLPALKPIIS